MIIEYIKSLFTTGLCSTRDEALSYMSRYGVEHSVYGNLVQLSYNLFNADWSVPMTHYCRGTILSWPENSKTPSFVAQPFMKFFNFGEKYSTFKTDADVVRFVKDGGKLTQKADGTCIILYHTGTGWKASTLGSIPTTAYGDNKETFAEMFWRLFDFPLFNLSVGVTYVFELCTEFNQVVTEYESDRLYFLAALHDWTPTFGVSYRSIVHHIDAGGSKIMLPKVVDIPDTVNTISDLQHFIRTEFVNGLGKNPEGVVGTINGVPKFKLKFAEYLELHKTMTGDDRCVRKRLVKRFFEGTVDDIYADITEEQKKFIDRLKEMVQYLDNEVINKVLTYVYKEGMTKPEFAVEIEKFKKIADKEHRSFYAYFYKWWETRITFTQYLLSKGKNNDPIYINKIDFFKAV